MRLNSDWRRIVRKAKSVRWLAVAGVLSAIEMILPMYSDAFPRGVFALLTLFSVTAAFIARICVQKDFE